MPVENLGKVRRATSSLLQRCREGVEERARFQFSRWRARWSLRTVSIDQLLMGGECGIPAAKYARLVGDPLRPSTPIAASPHVKLLQQYEAIGPRLFEPGSFQLTAYYRNALQCLDITGGYFDAHGENQIEAVARRFVDRYKDPGRPYVPVDGQSLPHEPIHVRPILYSDKFEIIDGQHRLAIAYMNGERQVQVLPQRTTALTPLQSLVLDVHSARGRRELCQPINSPELEKQWPVAHPCSDRLSKMRDFLSARGLLKSQQTYLDLGSRYGWFVAEMRNLGFDAHGVERDPIAASLGPLVYRLKPEQISRTNCVRFLGETDNSFDVISCFSLLHRFALGHGAMTAEDFIRLIDRRTAKVLFLETGQNHEARFRGRLSEWDADFVESWLKKNTGFARTYRLGPADDARPPFGDRYARMLFACVK